MEAQATNGHSFEEAVGQLEEIVSTLEMGNLPLDECLRRFEQAVALSRFCAGQLEAAENQISVLTAEGPLPTPADLTWADQ